MLISSIVNRRIGSVSLGCPKALVDSERILKRLRAEGYETVPAMRTPGWWRRSPPRTSTT
jgi:hypothetical protein